MTTASSQAVVGLMEDIGGHPPVPLGELAALAAALNDALDGKVATLRGETMNDDRIDRSCDEHARIFHAPAGRGGAGA